jgi:hypothetical protein
MATFIPENPDAFLTRPQTAAALSESGFPITVPTLATKATRGGGPPFHRFGKRVLYRWGSALDWARSRLSPALRSTAEAGCLSDVSRGA